MPSKTNAKKTPKAKEKKVKLNKETIIEREGCTIYFLNPKNEKDAIELRNAGKVIGEVSVSSKTMGDSIDEIIIIVRK